MLFDYEVDHDDLADQFDSPEELDLPFEEDDFRAMGVEPEAPTEARPGSEAKVIMLAARYAAGLPLWHDSDCYDHGPSENALKGRLPKK